MSYLSWFKEHGRKHADIMQKLTHLSDIEVIKYFHFENMLKNEPDFCLLYQEGKKCHEIEDLNCYLCACPNFRFDDNGFRQEASKTLYSVCNIESKDGNRYVSEDAIHQNCAGCAVPHVESYIKKHFSRDWFEIMQSVPCNSKI